MATNIWTGNAAVIQQVNLVTPASVAATNTFTVTINGKAFTYTAVGTTVAEVTAGLLALLTANGLSGDITELSFSDISTALKITGPTSGAPFTQTSGATGGTATLVTSTTVTASSPNDIKVTSNWSLGAIPVSTNDVIVDNTATSLLWNLDAISGVTLASLTLGPNFTGTIGLPTRNTLGYQEYRPQYLLVGATLVNVGGSNTIASGSGRIKINFGSVQTTTAVYSTGPALDQGLTSVQLRGTHASNSFSVLGGSLGLALQPGETSTALTVHCGGSSSGQVTFQGGAGLTLGTITQLSGTVVLNNTVTTVQKQGGTFTMVGSGTCTTLNNYAGSAVWRSSGTVTTWYVGAQGTADFSQDDRAITITNFTLEPGGALADPAGRVTYTNGVVCTLSQSKIDFGPHRTVTPS